MNEDLKWFPQVGTECEVRCLGEYHNKWFKIKVTAVTDTFVIGYIRDEWESCLDKNNPYTDFRPIRSEEDKAVEEMLEVCKQGSVSYPTSEEMMRRLYRAEYRRKQETK